MSNSNRRCITSAGFTLLELMIAVTIVATLAAIAISAYWSYLFQTRMAGEINNLAVSLYQARIDALSNGTPVSVCPSNNGVTCSGSRWEGGWIVFTDTGAPGQVDGTDAVLRIGQPIDSVTNLTIDGTVPYVRFVPQDLRFAK